MFIEEEWHHTVGILDAAEGLTSKVALLPKDPTCTVSSQVSVPFLFSVTKSLIKCS